MAFIRTNEGQFQKTIEARQAAEPLRKSMLNVAASPMGFVISFHPRVFSFFTGDER